MNNHDVAFPMGWTILLLGAATLLVVFATQRNKSGSLLGAIGLGGMIIATIGAGIQGTLIPSAIIAAIACVVLLFTSVTARGKTARASSRTCLGLAIGSGLLAVVALVIAIATPKPSSDPEVVFDVATMNAEQRASLDIARLDIELLLQRDLPRREQAAREAQQWKLLEALSLFRNRTLKLRARLSQAIEQLDLPNAPPMPQEDLQRLLEEVQRTLDAGQGRG